MIFSIILFITSFLRTLFIIIIIWYGIKLVAKYILPMVLHKTMKNMQSKVEEEVRERQRSNRPEGEVTIERNPNNNRDKLREGEYVDFEEVD